MIFTIIINSENFKNFCEKRDCQFRQPLTLIPEETLPFIDEEAPRFIDEETFRFIEKTQNPKIRQERFAAYSLLSFAAKKFFGVNIKKISRDEFGKPYISESVALKKEEPSELFFSISHSDGLCAVTLSDEGKCGVDIQAMPDSERAEKLSKRFLSSFEIDEKKIQIIGDLYIAEPIKDGFLISHHSLDTNIIKGEEEKNKEVIFLKKWTLCEAILKCFGTGFSDIKKLNLYKEECDISFLPIKVSKKIFGVSVSLKRIRT